ISTTSGLERFKDAMGGNEFRNYAIVVRSGGTTGNPNGTWVDLGATGVGIEIPTPGVNSPAVANININDVNFNGTCDIIATIDVTNNPRKTKSVVVDAQKNFTTIAKNVKYSLGQSDGIRVTGVYMSANSS